MSYVHLRLPYYRPSWQGGDTQHSKCMKPVAGWGGPYAASVDMTDDASAVTCPDCLKAKRVPVERRVSKKDWDAVEPPNDEKHLRRIRRALKGMGFPVLSIGVAQPTLHLRQPTPSDIIAEIAQRSGLTREDLLGPSRKRLISHVRHEAMWELRRRTKLSLPQIAAKLNRTNHTTALHGIRTHDARLAAEAERAAA